MDVGIEQKLHWLLIKWWLVFRASWPRMLHTGKFLRERKEEKIKENKREKEIREEKSKEEKRGWVNCDPGGKSTHTGVLVYFMFWEIIFEVNPAEFCGRGPNRQAVRIWKVHTDCQHPDIFVRKVLHSWGRWVRKETDLRMPSGFYEQIVFLIH